MRETESDFDAWPGVWAYLLGVLLLILGLCVLAVLSAVWVALFYKVA